MKKILFTFLIIVTIFTLHAKNKRSPKTLKAIKLSNSISVDGKLTEDVYLKNPIEGFIQRDPEEGKIESEKTQVWVTYDEKNIYVSAKLYDSNPDAIDASLMRRDNIVESDWFFFFVDP